MRHTVILSVVFSVFMPAAAQVFGAQPFKSPAEVYAVAKRAICDKDYESLSTCLTSDSMEGFAWVAVVAACTTKKELSEPRRSSNDATPETIDALLRTHGVSPTRATQAILSSFVIDSQEDRFKLWLSVLEDVKHKPKFVVETYVALKKAGIDVAKLDPVNAFSWLSGDFTDLKIDGNDAFAQVPQFDGGKVPMPVFFKKSEGAWHIFFPMDLSSTPTRRSEEMLKKFVVPREIADHGRTKR
jgi:hypothetical protein